MHIFDYSFLDEGLLPAEIVNLTSKKTRQFTVYIIQCSFNYFVITIVHLRQFSF